MLIRPVNLADRAELLAAHTLQRAAYETEADLIGTREIPGLTETLQQLAASGEQFHGAFEADALAGIIATEDEQSQPPRTPLPIRISRLAVAPQFFRRGIGRALVRHVINTLGRAQPRTLLVSTGAANTPARALYESEGFHFIRSREVGRQQRVRIAEYQWP